MLCARVRVFGRKDGDGGAVDACLALFEVGVELLRLEEPGQVGEADTARGCGINYRDLDLDVGTGGGDALEGGVVDELEHEVVEVPARHVEVLRERLARGMEDTGWLLVVWEGCARTEGVFVVAMLRVLWSGARA